jgi:hypothetical protein
MNTRCTIHHSVVESEIKRAKQDIRQACRGIGRPRWDGWSLSFGGAYPALLVHWIDPETGKRETYNIALFHLARTAGKDTRYQRKLWASREYEKAHPEVSSTAAYKELCRQESWRY